VQYVLILPEILLAGLGLVLLGMDLFAKSKRSLAVAGVIGTLATLVAVLANFGARRRQTFGTAPSASTTSRSTSS